MTIRAWLYRGHQFFFALFAKPDPADLTTTRQILSPGEAALFAKLQPAEQAHAIEVYKKVIARAPNAPRPLQKAALLHDVGKAKHPLTLCGRVAIVIGQTLAPKRVIQWGTRPPTGWRAPFVVAAQHPRWGAAMAQAAGSSPLVVAIIRKHQDTMRQPPKNQEEEFLHILQSADDKS